MSLRLVPILVLAALLAACGSAPKKSGGGGYYKDDGPGASPPSNLDTIPDAVPKAEALHRAANRPYSVFGRDYVPATTLRPYKERGGASWYGRKFHGQKTAIGETYDMYAMSAAHPTLPLPSYARVTSLATGKSVVVRVNDRGPFFPGRIIDLSYAAAQRIGIAQRGSGEVEVEAVLPGEAMTIAAAPLPSVAAAPPSPPPASPPPAAAAPAGEPIPVAPVDGGFVVQLGAFASFPNAQNFVAHLGNQLAPLAVEPRIREQGGLYRVQVGPFATRDEANRMSDKLRDAFGLPSIVAR